MNLKELTFIIVVVAVISIKWTRSLINADNLLEQWTQTSFSIGNLCFTESLPLILFCQLLLVAVPTFAFLETLTHLLDVSFVFHFTHTYYQTNTSSLGFPCQLTVSFAFKICIAFREALTGILILRLIHVALFALSKINSAVLLCYSILISSWIALCKNEIREKKTDHKQALTWCVGDSSGPHCHLCKSTKKRLGWAMK